MVSSIEQTFIALLIVVIMFGMGASLTRRDFQLALRRPQALVIGIFSQYAFMPFIGFMLTLLLDLSGPIAIGILIMSCMPGGTTSNMFTYFARGNVALSILMTVSSTILGIFLIPLTIVVYSSALVLEIPTKNIVLTLLVVLVPVGLGMWLRNSNQKFGAVAERFGSLLAIIFIAFILVSWVPRNWDFLIKLPTKTHLAAILLCLIGITVGYMFAWGLRLPTRDVRTVALETGIQNGPLALAIIALTFTGQEQQSAMGIAALNGFYTIIISVSVMLGFRSLNRSADKIHFLSDRND